MRLAAVQWTFRPAASLAEWIESLAQAIAPAVERDAQLVVLPQYTGLALLAEIDDPAMCLRREGARLLRACREAGAQLAARFGVWLIPGSTIGAPPHVSGRSPWAEACLFAPDGSLALCQAQTHLGPFEKRAGLARGDSLDVIDTPLGRVGILVGADVHHPEVARILTLQGAQILAHTGAEPGSFDQDAWLGGLWREVQSNQVWGVEASLAGEWMGARYTGVGSVCAPVEMTPDKRGWLARGEGAQVAQCDPAALRQVIEDYPVLDYMNPPLYQRDFPKAYRSYGKPA